MSRDNLGNWYNLTSGQISVNDSKFHKYIDVIEEQILGLVSVSSSLGCMGTNHRLCQLPSAVVVPNNRKHRPL
ncbi:hypothetical protein [Calothrix sp. NIES-2098]|uniref:hypothetical protein n=1 Tax=Calothrix sp. NIES-2098 TaxID=1954171 RepID=UPI000B5E13C9|nr:hypothetical protein NIES2098_37190 [Calothrix sp. NIES-2098]